MLCVFDGIALCCAVLCCVVFSCLVLCRRLDPSTTLFASLHVFVCVTVALRDGISRSQGWGVIDKCGDVEMWRCGDVEMCVCFS